MAARTENSDCSTPLLDKSNQESRTESESTRKPATNTTEAFRLWVYIVLIVSFISFSGILLRALSPDDPKAWFLSLPDEVRDHYSSGRTIKVQMAQNQQEVGIFSLQQGPYNSESNVLIIHGIGCSSFSFRGIVKSLAQNDVHAVAIDLPGSGFSDRSYVVVEESKGESDPLGRLWGIIEDIKTKGLFWGFDQLLEQGYVDFEEIKAAPLKKESIKPIDLGAEEIGKMLGQVVDALGGGSVDLVLHDSALALTANWILENRGSIRSLLLLDSAPSATVFPLILFQVPIAREFSIHFTLLFQRVLAFCCMRSVDKSEADAHRVLLKGMDCGTTVFGMGKKLNASFNLSEWSSRDEIKGLPVHVICSEKWSDKWSSDCKQITTTLPQASLSMHSGGLWVQEHNSQELAQLISKFVSSLPKSPRPVSDFDDHKSSTRTGHHLHFKDPSSAHPGYADAYGLRQGWSV